MKAGDAVLVVRHPRAGRPRRDGPPPQQVPATVVKATSGWVLVEVDGGVTRVWREQVRRRDA